MWSSFIGTGVFFVAWGILLGVRGASVWCSDKLSMRPWGAGEQPAFAEQTFWSRLRQSQGGLLRKACIRFVPGAMRVVYWWVCLCVAEAWRFWYLRPCCSSLPSPSHPVSCVYWLSSDLLHTGWGLWWEWFPPLRDQLYGQNPHVTRSPPPFAVLPQSSTGSCPSIRLGCPYSNPYLPYLPLL